MPLILAALTLIEGPNIGIALGQADGGGVIFMIGMLVVFCVAMFAFAYLARGSGGSGSSCGGCGGGD